MLLGLAVLGLSCLALPEPVLSVWTVLLLVPFGLVPFWVVLLTRLTALGSLSAEPRQSRPAPWLMGLLSIY